MPLTQTQIDWAFNFCNKPEVYPDLVEQILDVRYEAEIVYIIAIDEGNPPIVPLKQLAFKLVYASEESDDLLSYSFKLLNPDEVEANDSRPQQFAAHLPIDYWNEILDADLWEAGCSEACAC
jgi:hypothetical protein